MAVLPVNYLGDSVLRKKSRPVEVVDEAVKKLVADMIETMYADEGVGLAAPQVSVLKRIIVYDNVTAAYGTDPQVLINPEIVDEEGSCRAEEGCLSIPELKGQVERSERVTAVGLDREGRTIEVRAEGLAARVLQHEIDHLDGILFVDRLAPVTRKLILSKWNKMRKELVAERGAT
jgi:peptide deformylase